MKKSSKILSLILSGVMMASTAAYTVNAQGDTITAGYGIEFDISEDFTAATATITVSGGEFGVGRVGFKYNTNVFELVDANGNEFDPDNSKMYEVVVGAETEDYEIVTTEETNLIKDLIDTESGKILFAWYADTNIVDGKDFGFVNASEEPKVIATINFKLPELIVESENPGEAFNNALGDAPFASDYVPEEDEELPGGYSDGPTNADGSTGSTEITDSAMPEIIIPEQNRIKTTGSFKFEVEGDQSNVGKYIVKITTADGNNSVCDPIIFDDIDGGTSEYKISVKDYNIGVGEYNVSITPVHKADNGYGYVSVPTNGSFKVVKSSSAPEGGSVVAPALTYTVTFNAGEGAIAEGQKYKYTVERDDCVAGSPSIIAPEGKSFAGWSVDGVTLITVETYKITKDTIFKAVYVDNLNKSHEPFIQGYTGGEFRPNDSLTRAEAAAIIARVSGKFDYEKTYTANFSDVAADHWAYSYIAFVYENGIVTGYEDGSFHPGSPITRAEFATIMQRYLGIELNEDANFVDVNKDHWAVAYIGACKDAGIINGYENGEFRPSNDITRAEAVKILNRATDRTPNPTAIDAYIAEKGVPFTDLDTVAWYFYEVIEAAIQHFVADFH